jgi:hypothetical protein
LFFSPPSSSFLITARPRLSLSKLTPVFCLRSPPPWTPAARVRLSPGHLCLRQGPRARSFFKVDFLFARAAHGARAPGKSPTFLGHDACPLQERLVLFFPSWRRGSSRAVRLHQPSLGELQRPLLTFLSATARAQEHRCWSPSSILCLPRVSQFRQFRAQLVALLNNDPFIYKFQSVCFRFLCLLI